MGNFKSRYLPWGELPQNIVGRISSRMWKRDLDVIPDKNVARVEELEARYKLKIYVVTSKSHDSHKFLKYINSHSCGKYICVIGYSNLETTILHEVGHAIQSKKYKWLYLFIVGIPSAVYCFWDKVFHKKWDAKKRNEKYYSKPWEREADELGGVHRRF